MSNHTNFQKRLDFILSIFKNEYNLEPSVIEPVDYDENVPFPYNNFIYRVDLASPLKTKSLKPTQPSTTSPPPGQTVFIVRLPNPDAGLDDTNRIENEIAIMTLGRAALGPVRLSHLIPEVYNWSTANQQQGWILMQNMPGINIFNDRPFPSMTEEEKTHVLSQMATITSAFQNYTLPSTIKSYGGLTFNASGEMISARTTIPYGGPFPSYLDLWQAIFKYQVHDSESSSILNGWRSGSNLRSRIDNFLSSPLGLSKTISSIPPSLLTPMLTHADLTTSNLLFSPHDLQLTAILDFDWSFIGGMADEFLRSFSTNNYQLPSPYSTDAEDIILRKSLLSGTFPSPSDQQPEEDLSFAKTFDEQLCIQKAYRPSTLPGFEILADLWWFANQIGRFEFCNPIIAERRGEEALREVMERVEGVEGEIGGWLGERGF